MHNQNIFLRKVHDIGIAKRITPIQDKDTLSTVFRTYRLSTECLCLRHHCKTPLGVKNPAVQLSFLPEDIAFRWKHYKSLPSLYWDEEQRARYKSEWKEAKGDNKNDSYVFTTFNGLNKQTMLQVFGFEQAPSQQVPNPNPKYINVARLESAILPVGIILDTNPIFLKKEFFDKITSLEVKLRTVKAVEERRYKFCNENPEEDLYAGDLVEWYFPDIKKDFGSEEWLKEFQEKHVCKAYRKDKRLRLGYRKFGIGKSSAIKKLYENITKAVQDETPNNFTTIYEKIDDTANLSNDQIQNYRTALGLDPNVPVFFTNDNFRQINVWRKKAFLNDITETIFQSSRKIFAKIKTTGYRDGRRCGLMDYSFNSFSYNL